LEKDDDHTAGSKAECNTDHCPDGPPVAALICSAKVEDEETKLDKHVASIVNGEDGRV